MTERQVDARRNWKAQVFPYDYYTTEPGEECTYCLTEKQAELLRGIIEPLAWSTRWWSDTDQTIEIDVIEEFRDDLVRRLMMSCCGDNPPAQFKYIDGVLYRSADGGATFEPAPDFDIREKPVVIFPEPPDEPGVDEICLAADGMVNLIKQQIGDNLTEGMSRYTLGELIRNWVETMIGTSNPFMALVTIVTNQIFALVVGAVIAALTDPVYTQLKCILSQHMLSDKSFDNAGWEAVRSDTLGITGIAGVFLEHLIYLLGAGGLTNLARSQAGEDDSGCCTECSMDLWSIATYGGNPIGSLVSVGANYIDVSVDPPVPGFGGGYFAQVTTPLSTDCCTLLSVEVLSGSGVIATGIYCGEPLWPSTEVHSIGDGSNVNTIRLVNPASTTSVVRLTFA